MTNIRATQSGYLVTLRYSASDVLVVQGNGLVAYNVPTFSMRATYADIHLTFRRNSRIDVSQANVLVTARGRIGNPRLRSWTFSLDGHDFYVLRLGDRLTLVYDVYSEQWVEWADLGLPFWRANIGQNWFGATQLGPQYGSDIVVGDDTWGVLWILDPDQPFDQHPDELNTNQTIFFDRIVMGQVPIRGREVMPCYAAWLTTDMGDPAYTGAAITMQISDDGGKTYGDMGSVEIVAGENTPTASWYSLGQIGAPGRLFKIIDDGAVARIDGLEMNDPDDVG